MMGGDRYWKILLGGIQGLSIQQNTSIARALLDGCEKAFNQ